MFFDTVPGTSIPFYYGSWMEGSTMKTMLWESIFCVLSLTALILGSALKNCVTLAQVLLHVCTE